MKKSLLLLISFCSFCLQNGCGGGASSTTQTPPPIASHLSVAAATFTPTVGTAFNFTVAALDASNHVVSSYGGTVHFSSSDTQAVLPSNTTLTNGTGTFSATLNSAGSQVITATDTATASIVGTSSSINVSGPAATHLSVVAPANEPAGTSFTFTVSALGASNNVVAAYAGTIHFSSSDAQAVLPSNNKLTNGTGTFTATLKTAGSQSITATDTTTASIQGTSAAVNVAGGAATHFSVAAPASASAGSLFSFTLTAFDASNNVASGYTGTVHFSSTDPQAILPANAVLAGGTADFPAMLKTIGTQSIKATDTVTASITGSSLAIKVSAATAENPVPFLNQPLSPTAVAPGAGGFMLTVKGTGFVPGSVVNWNTKPRVTSFVSDSKLTATILAADVASANTAAVTVVNPTPGGGASNVVFFEVTLSTSSVSLESSNLGSGTGPQSVAVGDFNGDGKLDMVVIYSGSNTVSISLGNGDGTFQPSVDYPSASFPFSVATGDFNADGKLDLVVANQNGNVSVLLGKGNGTFQPAVNYPTGMQSFSVAVGDFDGDGKLDVVTANYGSDDVSVLLGNGDGTFEPALNFPAGAQPGSVAIGDFNSDGKLDLAVTQSIANVNVLLGNGDGTFQAPVNYAAGANPTSVIIGDFNGDGKLDLAVADLGGNNGNLLLGNGDGTFQSALRFAAGTLTGSLGTGDFNGDGKLDLITTHASKNNVSVLLGNGDGTFQAPLNYAADATPASVAVGDFNGDGRLDFSIANHDSTGDPISLLLQDDSLGLSPASLSFSTQLIGTASSAKTATLTNTGFSALAISSIAIAGTGAADFGQSEACGSGLTARSSCTVNISFTPTQIGPRTASLIFTDDAAGSPQSVALNGIGLMTGHNATLAPTSLTFNPQNIGTESAGQFVALSNYGTTALSISGIAVTANFGESSNCGSSLASGASCTITVAFTPTASGTLTGTLSVTDDAPGSPQTVSLSGIGAAATTATLTPGQMFFFCTPPHLLVGGCTPPQRATLTNTGNATLYILGISLTGATNHFTETNNCPEQLEPGQACGMTVSFSAAIPWTKTSYSGTLTVSDTAGNRQGIALSGTASPF